MEKEKCWKCGELATWCLMSFTGIKECESQKKYSEDNFNGFACEKCVPRGCSCNDEPIDGDWENTSDTNWLRPTDEEGREEPCCEWWYDQNGWDKEETE